jgi:hypothetical protein
MEMFQSGFGIRAAVGGKAAAQYQHHGVVARYHIASPPVNLTQRHTLRRRRGVKSGGKPYNLTLKILHCLPAYSRQTMRRIIRESGLMPPVGDIKPDGIINFLSIEPPFRNYPTLKILHCLPAYSRQTMRRLIPP